MKRKNKKMLYYGSFKTEELARQYITNNIHLFLEGDIDNGS